MNAGEKVARNERRVLRHKFRWNAGRESGVVPPHSRVRYGLPRGGRARVVVMPLYWLAGMASSASVRAWKVGW